MRQQVQEQRGSCEKLAACEGQMCGCCTRRTTRVEKAAPDVEVIPDFNARGVEIANWKPIESRPTLCIEVRHEKPASTAQLCSQLHGGFGPLCGRYGKGTEA